MVRLFCLSAMYILFLILSYGLSFAYITEYLGSAESALIAWFTLVPLIALVKQPSFVPIFFSGLLGNCLTYRWLFHSALSFSNITEYATYLAVTSVLALCSLQFIFFKLLYDALPQELDRFCVRSAIAWTACEILPIRLFPLYFGHYQIGFLPLAQIAAIGGVLPLSFIMLWVVESALNVTKYKLPITLSGSLLYISFGYGLYCMGYFKNVPGVTFPVALVQPNISPLEKKDLLSVKRNADSIHELTERYIQPHLLAIWPENSFPWRFEASIRSRSEDSRLPTFSVPIHLIIGAETIRGDNEVFNSAVAIYDDGRIHSPSHKEVLFPFIEKIPFLDFFAWTDTTMVRTIQYVPGTKRKLFKFNFPQGTLPLMTMICYEELFGEVGRQATLHGAQALVSMSDDSWFGDFAASKEHHAMASFRAIENRRFLLRSTNNGMTAVVSPTGETIAQLPLRTPGVLRAEIPAMKELTIYTRVFGESFIWVLWGIILMLLSLKSTVALRKRLRPQ